MKRLASAAGLHELPFSHSRNLTQEEITNLVASFRASLMGVRVATDLGPHLNASLGLTLTQRETLTYSFSYSTELTLVGLFSRRRQPSSSSSGSVKISAVDRVETKNIPPPAPPSIFKYAEAVAPRRANEESDDLTTSPSSPEESDDLTLSSPPSSSPNPLLPMLAGGNEILNAANDGLKTLSSPPSSSSSNHLLPMLAGGNEILRIL